MMLGISFLFVTILEIWAVNRMSSYGEKINKIEETTTVLRMENQILKNKIDERMSLSRTKGYSTKLGFEKIQKMEYIKGSDQKSLTTVNAF